MLFWATGSDIMIEFIFEDVDQIELPANAEEWLGNLIICEGKKLGPITYIFCSDEYLLKINQRYLSHDYYTDIITFDYVKGKIISGDIFVSLHRISENAHDHQTNFESELLRVLAHGVLHLCGYSDKLDHEQDLMTQKEDHYINLFYQNF